MSNIYRLKRDMYPVEAQEIGEELEAIEKECGGIRPDAVVERSRPKDAVLHNCFEWRNNIAAEKWREQQARVLIDNVVIVQTEESEQYIGRAFACVSYKTDDEEEETKQQYVSMSIALNDEEYRKQLYDRALRELQSFQRKYSQLKELDSLFGYIDDLTKEIQDNTIFVQTVLQNKSV